MDTTIIVIQSDKDSDLTIPEKLKDVGKQLTKLMYNTQKGTLNNKSIIVVFPDNNTTSSVKCIGGVEEGRVQTCENNISHEIIALQNSIRHIVRHAIKHGIDITIQEHVDKKNI
tara:strand:+ start:271 stop:612 length:342 start_codon:yes stop_codon:yes gene_type:complete